MASFANLIAGNFPQVQEAVLIAAGQKLAAGCILGKKTTDGKFYAVDSSKSDGTQTAVAILTTDVDTSVGSVDAYAVVCYTGVFNSAKASFGGSDTVATHKDALAARCLFLKSVGVIKTEQEA